MSEVQRFQHVSPLCKSTDELMRLYPMATQYVLAVDFDKLEAENQALKAELEALRSRVVVVPERKHVPICAVSTSDYNEGMRHIGWNACLDELARLNGKAVSEGLLRRLCPIKGSDGWTTWHSKDAYEAAKELAAILDGEPT